MTLVHLALGLAACVTVTGAGEHRFCKMPSHCPPDAVCVAGACLEGADRARVEVLHTVAVPDPTVLADEPWLRQAASQVGRQLRRDLVWTGFYGLLPAERFPGGWQREGARPSRTQRVRWMQAGAARVVKASLWPDLAPGAFRLRIRLVHTEADEVVDLPSADVVVRPGGARHAVARWVNALVGHDTGLPGSAGTRIAVSVRVRTGVKEVAIVESGEGRTWYATANGSLNLGPAWRPDGALGYMSYRGGNPDWLVDGEAFSDRPGLNAAGSWSPDGRFLALSVAEDSNSDLVLLDATTGEEHSRLTDHPAVDTSPAWSPDGRRIAFVSDRGGGPEIWILTLADGGLSRLTQGGYITSPAWSPLGDTLVYAQLVRPGVFSIVRRNLATGATKRLTPTSVSAESPAFSPDGRYLAFVRREGDKDARLWMMHVDGKHARPVPSPVQPTFSPAWNHGTWRASCLLPPPPLPSPPPGSPPRS